MADEQRERKVIEADEFVLRDSNGKVRCRLGFVGESDFPSISFFDKNGQIRLDAGLNEVGPHISILDEESRLRVCAVHSDKDNVTSLVFGNAHNSPVVSLLAGPNHRAGLFFYDAEQEINLMMGTADSGKTVFYNANDQEIPGSQEEIETP